MEDDLLKVQREAEESDDESFDEDRKLPHWARMPDQETEYSDWQIDVKCFWTPDKPKEGANGNCKDGKENVNAYDTNRDGRFVTASYLVHRYRIGCQSEYFDSIFRDNSDIFSERHERRSVIEFPADAPVNLHYGFFEHLLSYFYCDDARRKASTLNEDVDLPMLYLADYFGVKKLRKKALNAIRSKLQRKHSVPMEWVAKLYRLAEALSIEEFQDSIAIMCHNDTSCFRGVWGLLQTSDLKHKLLYRICCLRKKIPDKGTTWSPSATYVIRSNPEIVDKDLFSKLTDKDILRPIDLSLDDAIEYLKHEYRLGLDERNVDRLTCLQQRCTDVLYDRKSGNWEVSPSFTPDRILNSLLKLKSAIIQSLLLRAIERNNQYADDEVFVKSISSQ